MVLRSEWHLRFDHDVIEITNTKNGYDKNNISWEKKNHNYDDLRKTISLKTFKYFF